MIEYRSFSRSPQSVGQARHFVTDVLGGLSKEIADRAAVMISELATNAIRHAGTDFVVRIERTEQLVCIEVVDGGVGKPSLRHAQPRDRSGRGLRIVDVLSDEWGVRRDGSGRGKAVWFNISLESAGAAASRSTVADPPAAAC